MKNRSVYGVFAIAAGLMIGAAMPSSIEAQERGKPKPTRTAPPDNRPPANRPPEKPNTPPASSTDPVVNNGGEGGEGGNGVGVGVGIGRGGEGGQGGQGGQGGEGGSAIATGGQGGNGYGGQGGEGGNADADADATATSNSQSTSSSQATGGNADANATGGNASSSSHTGDNSVNISESNEYKVGAITGAPAIGSLFPVSACSDGNSFSIGGGNPFVFSLGLGWQDIDPAGVALGNGLTLHDYVEAAPEERMAATSDMSDGDKAVLTCLTISIEQYRADQSFHRDMQQQGFDHAERMQHYQLESEERRALWEHSIAIVLRGMEEYCPSERVIDNTIERDEHIDYCHNPVERALDTLFPVAPPAQTDTVSAPVPRR